MIKSLLMGIPMVAHKSKPFLLWYSQTACLFVYIYIYVDKAFSLFTLVRMCGKDEGKTERNVWPSVEVYCYSFSFFWAWVIQNWVVMIFFFFFFNNWLWWKKRETNWNRCIHVYSLVFSWRSIIKGSEMRRERGGANGWKKGGIDL